MTEPTRTATTIRETPLEGGGLRLELPGPPLREVRSAVALVGGSILLLAASMGALAWYGGEPFYMGTVLAGWLIVVLSFVAHWIGTIRVELSEDALVLGKCWFGYPVQSSTTDLDELRAVFPVGCREEPEGISVYSKGRRRRTKTLMQARRDPRLRELCDRIVAWLEENGRRLDPLLDAYLRVHDGPEPAGSPGSFRSSSRMGTSVLPLETGGVLGVILYRAFGEWRLRIEPSGGVVAELELLGWTRAHRRFPPGSRPEHRLGDLGMVSPEGRWRSLGPKLHLEEQARAWAWLREHESSS